MKKIKHLLLLLGLFVAFSISLYQLDFIKRSIASKNHRIDLPNYFEDISIDKPESIIVLAAFNSSITKGKITVDRLIDFYTKIHGVQIIVEGKPKGTLSEFTNLMTDNFSIIFIDNKGQLNGATINLSEDKKNYLIEIKSSRE